jgi:hypothetical protein
VLKRRNFLTGCAAGASTLLVPVELLAGTGESDLSPKETFLTLLHQSFRCLDGAAGARSLELVEVRDGPGSAGLEQFSLVFTADDASLTAGLHEIYHPRTGLNLYRVEPSDSLAGHYTSNFTLLA